jgi:hypothetical protein
MQARKESVSPPELPREITIHVSFLQKQHETTEVRECEYLPYAREFTKKEGRLNYDRE